MSLQAKSATRLDRSLESGSRACDPVAQRSPYNRATIDVRCIIDKMPVHQLDKLNHIIRRIRKTDR
jgi:hypothetical protein